VASERHGYGSREPANDAVVEITTEGQSLSELDRLHRLLASAEQNGDPSLLATAHAHMAWVLAHRGDALARSHAESAWDYFSVHQDSAVWTWHTAITLAWLRATAGDGEGVGDVLAVGIAAWRHAGEPPFDFGSILFEFDRYPALLGALERHGVHLDREAGRAIDSANRLAAAAAHCCLARCLRREPSCRNRQVRVAMHLDHAMDLLRAAGATAALVSTLDAAVSQADATGETDKAASLRQEQSQLKTTLSESLPEISPSDVWPPAFTGKIHQDWVRLDEVDRRYIGEVLCHTRGRITGPQGAAAILGLKPSTLSWRIDKLGLRDILAEARRTARPLSPKKRRAKG